MEMTQIATNLFVSPQITEEDLAALANDGFTDVVCNRPDAEHPETAPSMKMAQIAKRVGIAFHYHPITPGEPFTAQAKRLSGVVAQPNAKVLAYCRSGARAANAWALAQTSQNGVYA